MTIKVFMDLLYKLLLNLLGLFEWLFPLTFFILVLCLPRIIWHPSFTEYLNFVNILVWPYTILVILFFFKKVVTYLFFSMDEFNFFGAKGTLKNVNEVIVEEVNKRLFEEKNEERRKVEMKTLSNEIKEKETLLQKAEGTADENFIFAKDVLKEWKSSSEKSKVLINELTAENNRLKEIISGLPNGVALVNAVQRFGGQETSDTNSLESSMEHV